MMFDKNAFVASMDLVRPDIHTPSHHHVRNDAARLLNRTRSFNLNLT